MHSMQWLTNQSGAPWMVEDYTSCLNQSNPGQYSWYHCGVTTSVYPADTLNAWTGNH
jgi:hypothetical protein